MFVCTKPFEAMAKVESMGMGLPELPIVVVPHPLMTRTPAELSEMAEALLPRIVDAALQRSGEGA